MPHPPAYDNIMAQLAASVTEHGIAVMGIFPTVEDGPMTPPFNYSVGLTELDKPEVLLIGLNLEVGQHVCNEIYRRVVDGSVTLEIGEEIGGLVGGPYLMRVCEVTHHEANMARLMYGDDVRVVQVVYQAVNGFYPWQDEYDQPEELQGTAFVAP